MLVIRRRPGQAVLIGEDIEITVVEAGPNRVKLGISAPREITVLRKEIQITVEENRRAAEALAPGRLQAMLKRMGLPPGAEEGSGNRPAMLQSQPKGLPGDRMLDHQVLKRLGYRRGSDHLVPQPITDIRPIYLEG